MARPDGGARHRRQPLTILAATSGDTGSAVAHAFHGVPDTRVVILYPDGRVSPTQEAQLTMFNPEAGECARLRRRGQLRRLSASREEAFADADLRRDVRLTSANSINIGRLLPQMIYYFHGASRPEIAGRDGARGLPADADRFSVPSGNFGNLAAGLMARRAGAPIRRLCRRDQRQRLVPRYLDDRAVRAACVDRDHRERDGLRQPEQLRSAAVALPDDLDAMRRDIAGSVHD